jgi:hypothetical protein
MKPEAITVVEQQYDPDDFLITVLGIDLFVLFRPPSILFVLQFL